MSANENDQESQPQEKKPDVSEPINLRVINQDGAEMAFKIRRSTPLRRLIDTYVKKTGVDASSVRFLYEDLRVRGDDTAEGLGMEDDDQIHVALQQLGGNNPGLPWLTLLNV